MVVSAGELLELLEAMGEPGFLRYYGADALELAKAHRAGWREATATVDGDQTRIRGRLREDGGGGGGGGGEQSDR